MAIFFNNETEISFKFDMEEVALCVVNCALDIEKFPFGSDVGINVVDNNAIQQINMQQRGIDSPTDVLSFPMLEYEIPGDFSFIKENDDCFDKDTGNVILGDIVLSAQKVIEQAILYGHSRKREYAFLIAHSMLHLMGYDHMNKEEEKVMFERQRMILDTLNIKR